MTDDDLSALIQQHASRYRADSALRAAVRTRVALEAAAMPDHPMAPPGNTATKASGHTHGRGFTAHALGPTSARPHPAFSWNSALAGLVLGLALSATGLWVWQQPPAQETLGQALIARHVQALGPGPLLAVVSSEHHTVKPWFQGRLDFSPPVPDLADQGFTLRGARVDRLDTRAVAALVYQRRQHQIEVFIEPSPRNLAPQAWQQRGFELRRWTDGGMQIALISDLNASELDLFVSQWRARQAGHAMAPPS